MFPLAPKDWKLPTENKLLLLYLLAYFTGQSQRSLEVLGLWVEEERPQHEEDYHAMQLDPELIRLTCLPCRYSCGAK